MGRLLDMTNSSRNVLVICGTVMFCVIVAALLAIVRFTHDTNSAVTLSSILFSNLAILIAALAALFKIESAKTTAEDTNDKVDRVLNGEMAAKIKTAYKEAMAETQSGKTHRT